MSTTSTMSKALALLLLASMFASCTANRNWRFGFNYTDWRLKHHRGWWHRHYHHPNETHHRVFTSNKIVVGGSEHWRFDFNYTRWAFNYGPFYLNDTLVFKYEPPIGKDSHPHSVYQLPDHKSFEKCDLSNAKQLANATQGSGLGFEFVLEKWQPYYFACGESNGFHCNVGHMKFFVLPIPRSPFA